MTPRDELTAAMDRAFSLVKRAVEDARQHGLGAVEVIEGVEDEARLPGGLRDMLGEARKKLDEGASILGRTLEAHLNDVRDLPPEPADEPEPGP